MKLYFRTKKNEYGNRAYLSIDTENKCFCTADLSSENYMEITSKAMKNLYKECEKSGFQYNWYGR